MPIHFRVIAFAIFALVSTSFSQVTVFEDDFDSDTSTTYTKAGQLGSSAFTVYRSGTDWGARRAASPTRLEISNSIGSEPDNAGWIFVGTPTSGFASPFTPILENNAGRITWTFNMRQLNSDPSGFQPGEVGLGFILAATSTAPQSTGTGYAVVLGQSGSVDPVRLVRFDNGLSGTLTNIIVSNTAGLTDVHNHYLTIRVVYDPAGGTWELLAFNGGTGTFTSPKSSSFASQGTAVDATYTAQTLSTMGPYYQGSTFLVTAVFDNVSVTVMPSPAQIKVTPESIDHGNVAVGSAGTPRTITIENAGGTDLNLGEITLAGTDAADFSLSNIPASGPIAPGASKVFQVSFNPSAIGTREAQVSIESDDAESPTTTVDLSGTGVQLSTGLVTKTADTNDGVCDADCSLREAIFHAAPGDTITFASPLFDSPQTITLSLAAELAVSKDLNISGPGARLLTIDGGGGANRLFAVSLASLSLSGVTLTGGGGPADGRGGAIYASGSLILDSVHVVGNSALFSGGAIYLDSGIHSIENSSITGNIAQNCGGIANVEGSILTLANSTISGNKATTNGGGVCNAGAGSSISIRNSTVSNNTATQGGGLFVEAGSVDLGSSILAQNAAAVSPEISLTAGTFTSSGFNLIGSETGRASDTATLLAYQATDILDTDPRLSPLGDHFGPTPTHSLLNGSPAIDMGYSFGSLVDQRGLSRTFDDPGIGTAPGGDNTDIGAYERAFPSAAKVTLSGRVMTVAGRALRGLRVTLESSAGVRTALTNPFGYFSFDEVEVNVGYVVRLDDPRDPSRQRTRFVMVNDKLDEVDFEVEQ